MRNNTVRVTFKDNKKKTFRNVSKVHTDINYSIFDFEHKNEAMTQLHRNDIHYIYFGKNVEIEVH